MVVIINDAECSAEPMAWTKTADSTFSDKVEPAEKRAPRGLRSRAQVSVFESRTTSRQTRKTAFEDSEVQEEIQYIVLGATSDDHDGQVEESIPSDHVMQQVDRQIRLQASCRSLPYTMCLYLAFIWSAWLKCDTYNFGVGSSVVEMFDSLDAQFFLGHKSRAKEFVVDGDALLVYLTNGLLPALWSEGHDRVRRTHKVVGGLRVRQFRSTVEQCEEGALRSWYDPNNAECRSWDGLSSEPYGGPNQTDPAFLPGKQNSKAFDILVPIAVSLDDCKKHLQDIWSQGWIDYRTSEVIIEVGFYNGEVDAWAWAKDSYNFRADGHVVHRNLVGTANNLFRRWYYFVADFVVVALLIGMLFSSLNQVILSSWGGTF
jgi:hypothetical protein